MDTRARLPPPVVVVVVAMVMVVVAMWPPGASAQVPQGCNGVLDIAIIMDESESIRENDPLDRPDYNWNIFKQFVRSLISNLPVGTHGTQIALAKYSSRVQIMWYLNTYQTTIELDNAVAGLQHTGGNTNTLEALLHTNAEVFRDTNGDRENAKNIIILMTDGLSTRGTQSELKRAAENIRAGRTEIYVVAIGKYIDEQELRNIAEDFSKNIIKVELFEQLNFIQRLLTFRLCGLPDPDLGPPEEPVECNQIFDLAFVVDNSGSIKDDYVRLKHFLVDFVNQFEVAPNKNRFAVVRFSTEAQTEFRLGAYNSSEDLRKRIQNMPFIDSHTNTAAGIRLTVDDVFSGSPGDRPRVRNVALLLTDGLSTREQNNTILEADRAKAAGISLFVVGITDKVNREELMEIASAPHQNHFYDSTAVRYLNALIQTLIKSICST